MASNVENIKLAPMNIEYGGVDLGYLDGDIEMTTEITTKEITAHQTGEDPISTIITGTKVSLSFTLKEVSTANLKLAMATLGGTHTPTGGSGTELFGIGSSKKFQNVFADAKRLVMHPVSNEASDRSEDWNYWKAYMKMESLTWSGEEFQTIPVTVEIFEDPTKPKEINKVAIGDGSQFTDV